MRKFSVYLLLFALFAGCSGTDQRTSAPASDNHSQDTFVQYVLPVPDSSYIYQTLRENHYPAPLADEIFKFYAKRNFQCVWFNEFGLTEQAGKVVNLVTDYVQSGIVDTNLFSYKVKQLYEKVLDSAFFSYENDTIIMETDLLFTAEFHRFSKIAWRGLDADRIKKLEWYLPVKKLSELEYLEAALAPENKFMSEKEPVFGQYLLMKSRLREYARLQNSGGWDSLPFVQQTLLPGDTSFLIPLLRKRIFFSDTTYISDDPVFDAKLADEIISVRECFGLRSEAVVDSILIMELNTPIGTRIRQMLLNLERWKWIPPDPGNTFIVINIPEFMLHVYQNDSLIKNMKVVVGKNVSQTVIFSAALRYIVFSPYWVIPQSILNDEILPAIIENPDYLSLHHLEVVTRATPPVKIDPGLISWKKYSGTTFPYLIRQQPGAFNALGFVKFLFPNNFSIYLHDTPQRDLFNKEERLFSHGCIRIAEPKWLATYLLADNPEWSDSKIDSAMNAGKEIYVPLNQRIPVYITYFTSWVDSDGRLNFRKDVYGHDRKLELELLRE